ncbi:chemotaxis protein CheD [Pseudomonas indica]|uniref:Probable chemoreceptor glutamine deamidase CheD n=1 Tax=Pseudomonas indica TaxID=137658 RepID=A0A1G9H8K8_9PSED|nr:chemotaxis protein CheD [Pseudomonas indica]SDL08753.1 chemotaxis protein CheD [Pseudomonas indica]
MRKPAPLIEVFLQPGELYFGDRHTRIRTVLGSCVSLVCWHPFRQIGGMFHFLLPTRPTMAGGELDGRYADEALELMLREIRTAKARPDEFRIQLFGGGSMFPDVMRGNPGQVGRKNVEAARRLLDAHGLACSGAHVEGVGHRSLIFDLWNGHVSVRHSAPEAGHKADRRA